MSTRHITAWALWFCVYGGAAAGGAESLPPATRGTLVEVTVYQGQALVTRSVDVPGPVGLREIIVTDLPERLLPGSLFAEALDGVEIRSVRYRVRPVEEDIREEVRKLDAEIQSTADAITANARQMLLITEQRDYLAKLEVFVAPTAQAELTHGVLNSDTLTALSQFVFAERKRIADEELSRAIEVRNLQSKQDTLQRQRGVLTSGSATMVREAVVFVNLKADTGRLRLRYLVDGASWSPSYNVRTAGTDNRLTLEYNASISQMTGEDWSDVQMVLSTATPSLLSQAPVLDPLAIHLAPQDGALAGQSLGLPVVQDYVRAKKELDERLWRVDQGRNNIFMKSSDALQSAGEILLSNKRGGVLLNDLALNDVASQLQLLEMTAADRIEPGQRSNLGPVAQGLSVSYELPGRTTLPSRSDRQMIQIASLPMQGEFYRVAVPLLTPYVYREARIINSSPSVLLAGPVSTYVGGQFVGSGDIQTVASGQPFTLGLGTDATLKATRNLVKKSQNVQGGNRVVEFSYELTIENFAAEAADVRVLDRMPTSDDTDVRVTLSPSGLPLCVDPAYEQSDKKRGVLRWDVSVPADAQGLKAFRLEYGLKVEHDKLLAIVTPMASAPAQQGE